MICHPTVNCPGRSGAPPTSASCALLSVTVGAEGVELNGGGGGAVGANEVVASVVASRFDSVAASGTRPIVGAAGVTSPAATLRHE